MSSNKRNIKTSLKYNNSPATSYLLSVLEERTRNETLTPGSSATSRVAVAFSSLDEILPHCGIYTPVLKIIRQELTDAVYSNTYTTPSSPVSGPQALQRVPYFELLQRMHHEKSDSKEVLQENDEKHKAKVLKLKQEIGEKEDINRNLQEEIHELNFKLKEVQSTVERKEEDIKKLEKKLTLNRRIAEEEIHRLKSFNRASEESKFDLEREIEDLRHYKISYQTLKDTFDLPPDKRPRRGFRRPVISTKKTQLLSSIEAASKLEQQMVEVQAKSLEEYDLFLEEVKAQLSSKKFSDNENDRDFFTEELQLESMQDEMNAKLKNFQRLISGTVVELELVRQHRDSLQNQLSRMEQAEHLAGGDAASNPPSSMAGGPGSSRMMTHEEVEKKTSLESRFSLESGLEEDTTPLVDPTSDPFNPQERLLSKYSAMLYTSINSGKSFDEISTARFCVSCGEKTAVCPHKVTRSDLIIPLPQGCTHIKVARPMVRVNLPHATQNGAHETDGFANQDGAKWLGHLPGSQRFMEFRDHDERVDLSVRRQLAPLWQDAKRRAGIDTTTSSLCATRDLNKPRILSIIEQFYANVIWSDDHMTSTDDVTTFRGYLYQFMSERYHEDEISTVASYDLITGIVKFAEQDKTILLLGHALAGLVDGSASRYALIMADLIDSIDWKVVGDFRTFAEAIYPFMEEDEIDHYILEYNAFSENKISKNLVLSYIIQVITKHKEPRFTNAESKLASFPVTEPGLMSKQEYFAAMENVAPLANEQLLDRLTVECMHSAGSEMMPFKRLAAVTAYLSLLQVWQLLKSQLNMKVTEARQQDASALTKLQTSKTLVAETGNNITMSQVKQLASNISRLRHAGYSQSQQSFHDDIGYWQSPPDTRDGTF